MIRTAGPSRMRHLEQRLANDDHLAEMYRNRDPAPWKCVFLPLIVISIPISP